MTLKGNKSKGQRALETEKTVQQLQMATRVSQMLLQQVGNSVQTINGDLNNLVGRQRDLQYRTLAIQSLLNLDIDAINRKSEELQIKDFEEAALKEDVTEGCTTTDVVEEDSVVVLTTTVNEDKGILRTRLKVADIGFPQLKQDLLGKKKNDVLTTEINGENHVITVLDVKKMPKKETTEQQ